MYSDPVNWVYSGQTFGTFRRAEESDVRFEEIRIGGAEDVRSALDGRLDNDDVLGIADGDWW